MNWFGGDSKKAEKKKQKEEESAAELERRHAEHARNQRIKHLSGANPPK